MIVRQELVSLQLTATEPEDETILEALVNLHRLGGSVEAQHDDSSDTRLANAIRHSAQQDTRATKIE